jgi:hypothetical protein
MTMTEQINQADATREAYQYFMRTDPDMRDMLGPIETLDDPVTGRTVRSRWAKIVRRGGSAHLLPQSPGVPLVGLRPPAPQPPQLHAEVDQHPSRGRLAEAVARGGVA